MCGWHGAAQHSTAQRSAWMVQARRKAMRVVNLDVLSCAPCCTRHTRLRRFCCAGRDRQNVRTAVCMHACMHAHGLRSQRHEGGRTGRERGGKVGKDGGRGLVLWRGHACCSGTGGGRGYRIRAGAPPVQSVAKQVWLQAFPFRCSRLARCRACYCGERRACLL